MKNQQIIVISDTLVEAVEHIKQLLVVKDYSSIYQIFTITLEGLQSIQPIIIEREKTQELSVFAEIEKSIVLFAEHLEKQNETQMREVLQFSLEPKIKKLNELLKVQEEVKKDFVIGIYYDPANPIEAYDNERLQAIMNEAKNQNCKVYLFASEDVDCENEVIYARYSLEDEKKTKIPLPDVINNIFPNVLFRQSEVEKWLRERIPFTTYPVGDKLRLPEKMLRETALGHLFIPFVGVTDMEKVYGFLRKYKKGVLKKTAAARGENIFFVEQRSKDRFVVEVNKKPIIMNTEGFERWITEYLIPESYILQQYKEFRTSKNEPYDIRAHVQKNGAGEWDITKIYPRIGSKKSILSNISRGGRTSKLLDFLKEEFGQEKGEEYERELLSLSLDIAQNIDRVYNYSIDELGLDLAIDDTGRIWMHEANGGPQSKYHEEERAKNTIAYAKYLGKNRMFLTSDMQEYTGFKNQYKYNKNTDELTDLSKEKVTIGLLYEKKSTHPKFLEACAIIANYNNNNFYAFNAADIDYQNKIIRAQVFQDFQWKEKIVRYPDVIYDRLRMNGRSVYKLPYVEFSGIPFTHTLSVKELNKLEIYNNLSKHTELSSVIIPYMKVEDIEGLLEFLNQHRTIILKPIHGSFAMGIIKLTKNEKNFEWSEDQIEKKYSYTQLKRVLKERGIIKNYLSQKFIESKSIDNAPIDMRIHLIKDIDKKWVVAKDYVRISNEGFKINTEKYRSGRGFSGQTAYIDRYLKRNFPEHDEEILEEIKQKSIEIAETFDEVNNFKVGEQALDLALTLDGDIYLIEINANRPGVFGYEYEIARYMIPYAASLNSPISSRGG